MKHIIMLLSVIITGVPIAAAQGPGLPAGYNIQPDPSGAPNVVRYDFDRDGKTDAFYAAEKKTGADHAQLIAVLKGGSLIRYSHPLSVCCGSVSQKNGVIDVHSIGMRGFTYYKFRWDAQQQDFRLIGYDTESFGNATQDGSGKSSLNMLTGAYEAAFNSWDEKTQKLIALPKVKRKVSLSRRIYLKDFGEDADGWLSDLNAKYLPKEVR